MENNLEYLKTFLIELESNDAARIEEAASSISSYLIGISPDGEWKNLDPKLSDITEAVLDLEIPKDSVQGYNSKLEKLISSIKSL